MVAVVVERSCHQDYGWKGAYVLEDEQSSCGGDDGL